MNVPIGTKSLYIKGREEAETCLKHYQANLTVEGYAKTTYNVLHEAEGPDGSVRLLVEWVDHNIHGVEISKAEMSYFCEPRADGGWDISLVEVISMPAERLLAGIPLH
ncbi:MAG: hypothetical protein MK098_08915 [Marinovum sp.]|nr:hypothetical protein [Marinovum sp.]